MKKLQMLLEIIVLITGVFSCSTESDLDIIINQLKLNNKVDLGILVNQEYDFLVILDEGASLQEYGLYKDKEDEWLGQKIIFFKNEKIIKQVNLPYYVSEPEEKNYLFFFNTIEPNKYCIKRNRGDSFFYLSNYEKNLKHSFFYYVE